MNPDTDNELGPDSGNEPHPDNEPDLDLDLGSNPDPDNEPDPDSLSAHSHLQTFTNNAFKESLTLPELKYEIFVLVVILSLTLTLYRL